MKVNAANGLARTLKPEGVPWVMEEERFAVADAFSRVTTGKHIGVRTILANLNAAGIPDGLRRDGAGLGGFLAAPGSSRKARARAPDDTRISIWRRRSSR